ncbi:MAG: hypothetical protein GF308_21945 [Candidatus Heimdallarchaeota archaeon]|nr:hypothetical protein [Candidatus Heimdallarchaeota archaeon]
MTIDQTEKEGTKRAEKKHSLIVSFKGFVDYEVLQLAWTRTPNWLEHPFLFALSKEAISNNDVGNTHIVNIERKAFWNILSAFLVKDIELFEQNMAEQGVNTRKELLLFFQKALDAESKGERK